MQNLLPIGTPVKMSLHGRLSWPNCLNNPHNLTGKIKETFPERFPDFVYRVMWDNGRSNSYRKNDLDFSGNLDKPLEDFL